MSEQEAIIEIMPEIQPPGLGPQLNPRFDPFFGRQLPNARQALPVSAQSAYPPPPGKILETPQADVNQNNLRNLQKSLIPLLSTHKKTLFTEKSLTIIKTFLTAKLGTVEFYGGAANHISSITSDVDVSVTLNEPEIEKQALKQQQTTPFLQNYNFPVSEYIHYVEQVNSAIISGDKNSISNELAEKRIKLRKSLILAYLAQQFPGASLVPYAKVPVLKVIVKIDFQKNLIGEDCGKEYQCLNLDICVNNALPVQNTKLIKNYIRCNENLHDFIIIIKIWASKREILHEINLHSYFYVNLVIFYMQTLERPQLPKLQPGKRIELVNGYNASFLDYKCIETGFSLSQLIFGFFFFYGYYFNWDTSVVSIRAGRAFSREEKLWIYRAGDQNQQLKFRNQVEDEYTPFNSNLQLSMQNLPVLQDFQTPPPVFTNIQTFCAVEDPFETNVNIARNVNANDAKILKQEFRRAACVIKREKPLDWLFIGPDVDPPGQKQNMSLRDLKDREKEGLVVEIKMGDEKKSKFKLQ